MSSIAERLRYAREQAGFKNSTEFCAAFDLRHNTYDHHETGRRGVKLKRLAEYAEMLGVNFLWLAEGKGPMRKDDPETEILDLVRVMTAEQIRAWISVGRVMVDPPRAMIEPPKKNTTKSS